ncbi:hypothetical protein [Pseudalkalibacillus hwajinpoensis]|uniref:hypothetical protein n=1 Tax=Guptibacillus hwajinpoensis TaxID=208199 RepID=UPI001CD6FABB|nr:hypothetical protein [Pseudalkalibacillus hwajinpoensis]MCA0993332.1 hypothetical protein [Pseudalkalibacillus hwajinpoensis]
MAVYWLEMGYIGQTRDLLAKITIYWLNRAYTKSPLPHGSAFMRERTSVCMISQTISAPAGIVFNFLNEIISIVLEMMVC